MVFANVKTWPEAGLHLIETLALRYCYFSLDTSLCQNLADFARLFAVSWLPCRAGYVKIL